MRRIAYYLVALPLVLSCRAHADIQVQGDFEELLVTSCDTARAVFSASSQDVQRAKLTYMSFLLREPKFSRTSGLDTPLIVRDLKAPVALPPVDFTISFNPEREIERRRCVLSLLRAAPQQAIRLLPDLVVTSGLQRLSLLDTKLESELISVILLLSNTVAERQAAEIRDMVRVLAPLLVHQESRTVSLALYEIGDKVLPPLVEYLPEASLDLRTKIITVMSQIEPGLRSIRSEAEQYLFLSVIAAHYQDRLSLGFALLREQEVISSRAFEQVLLLAQSSAQEVRADALSTLNTIAERQPRIDVDGVAASRSLTANLLAFLLSVQNEEALVEALGKAYVHKFTGAYEELRRAMDNPAQQGRAKGLLYSLFTDKADVVALLKRDLMTADVAVTRKRIEQLSHFNAQRTAVTELLESVVVRECKSDKFKVRGAALAVDAAQVVRTLRLSNASALAPCFWDALLVVSSLQTPRTAAQSAEVEDIRVATLEGALLELGERGASFIAQKLASKEPLERTRALLLLAQSAIVAKKYVERATELLSDKDQQVRNAAFKLLLKHGFQVSRSLLSVIQALPQEDRGRGIELGIRFISTPQESSALIAFITSTLSCKAFSQLFNREGISWSDVIHPLLEREVVACVKQQAVEPQTLTAFYLRAKIAPHLDSVRSVVDKELLPLSEEVVLLKVMRERGGADTYVQERVVALLSSRDPETALAHYRDLITILFSYKASELPQEAFKKLYHSDSFPSEAKPYLATLIVADETIVQELQDALLDILKGEEVQGGRNLITALIAKRYKEVIDPLFKRTKERGVLHLLAIMKEAERVPKSPPEMLLLLARDVRPKVRLEAVHTLLLRYAEREEVREVVREALLAPLGDALRSRDLGEQGRALLDLIAKEDSSNAVQIVARIARNNRTNKE